MHAQGARHAPGTHHLFFGDVVKENGHFSHASICRAVPAFKSSSGNDKTLLKRKLLHFFHYAWIVRRHPYAETILLTKCSFQHRMQR